MLDFYSVHVSPDDLGVAWLRCASDVFVCLSGRRVFCWQWGDQSWGWVL